LAVTFDFQGKSALVTGGAPGIGEACVRTFAAGGARVLVADLSAALGEKVVAAVQHGRWRCPLRAGRRQRSSLR